MMKLFAVGIGLAFVIGVPAMGKAAPLFEGKRVTLVISSGTGGSTDLMARMAARHLSKHLAGQPSVIARNMQGAGGLVGMNYIYNQAPKDGTELGASIGATPFAPLFYGESERGKNIKFDPLKLNWIGSPRRFVGVAIAWHTAPVKKWQDLLKEELIVGSSGLGASSTVDAVFLRNLLGFKYKVIIGYPSGADTDLAMVRGETQGRANTDWHGLANRHPEWLAEKKVAVLYQMGLEPDPDVPSSIPLLLNEIEDPEKKAVLELKMAVHDLGYPIYAPPGTPSKTVAELRQAVARTYADPAYVADAKKARMAVTPSSGEKLESIVRRTYAAPEHLKQKLRQALEPKETFAKAKTVKVDSVISALTKNNRVVEFRANGKKAQARLGKGTRITVGDKKAEAIALRPGMTCVIEYFGEMSQAKALKCR